MAAVAASRHLAREESSRRETPMRAMFVLISMLCVVALTVEGRESHEETLRRRRMKSAVRARELQNMFNPIAFSPFPVNNVPPIGIAPIAISPIAIVSPPPCPTMYPTPWAGNGGETLVQCTTVTCRPEAHTQISGYRACTSIKHGCKATHGTYARGQMSCGSGGYVSVVGTNFIGGSQVVCSPGRSSSNNCLAVSVYEDPFVADDRGFEYPSGSKVDATLVNCDCNSMDEDAQSCSPSETWTYSHPGFASPGTKHLLAVVNGLASAPTCTGDGSLCGSSDYCMCNQVSATRSWDGISAALEVVRPTVSSITLPSSCKPNGCPTTGGFTMAIYGDHLGAGAASTSGRTAVTVRGVDCVGCCGVASDTQYRCHVPAGAGSAAPLRYLGGGYDSCSAMEVFSVPFAPPTVTGVDDSALAPALGGQITITGSNFGPDATNVTVLVGHYKCEVVSINTNHNSLACTMPPGHGAGHAISILVFDQLSNSDILASYLPPEVSGIAPASSTPTRGGTVTIYGNHFGNDVNVVGVAIRGEPCTVSTVSDNAVVCEVSSGTGKDLQVSVRVGNQASAAFSGFSFGAPLISGVSGNHVLGTRGGRVWSNRAQILFGENLDCIVDEISHETIKCTLGEGLGVDMRVSVSVDGQTAQWISWSFASPTISTIYPESAPVLGGNTTAASPIVITGTNFGPTTLHSHMLTATLVHDAFENKPCAIRPQKETTDHTRLACALPGGVGSGWRIRVTVTGSTGGTVSGESAQNSFAFEAPAATRLSPLGGTSGGNTISLFGVNFGNTASLVTVRIGGQTCQNIAIKDDGELTCTAPQGAGLVEVTELSVAATQARGAASVQALYDEPSLLSVVPTRGAQGEEIILSGASLGHEASSVRVFFTYGDGTKAECEAVRIVKAHFQIACTVPSARRAQGVSLRVEVATLRSRESVSFDVDNPCELQQFSDPLDNFTCVACPLNSARHGFPDWSGYAPVSHCTCDVGYYGSSTGVCSACPARSTTPYTGAKTVAECTLCTGGNTLTGDRGGLYFGPFDSQEGKCSPCPANTRLVDGECVCDTSTCPFGQYISFVAEEDWRLGCKCYECPDMHASAVKAGATNISGCICDEGWFDELSGPFEVSCERCRVGEELRNENSTACSECAAGFYKAVEGQYPQPGTQCIPCGRGYYAEGLGNRECTACPYGSTTGSEGATTRAACVCDSNSFLASDGVKCTKCQKGRRRVTTAGSIFGDSCVECSAGRYKSIAGQLPGAEGDDFEMLGCAPCPANTWSIEGSSFCTECPPHSSVAKGNGTAKRSCICEPLRSLVGSECLCEPGAGITPYGWCELCPMGKAKNIAGDIECSVEAKIIVNWEISSPSLTAEVVWERSDRFLRAINVAFQRFVIANQQLFGPHSLVPVDFNLERAVVIEGSSQRSVGVAITFEARFKDSNQAQKSESFFQSESSGDKLIGLSAEDKACCVRALTESPVSDKGCSYCGFEDVSCENLSNLPTIPSDDTLNLLSRYNENLRLDENVAVRANSFGPGAPAAISVVRSGNVDLALFVDESDRDEMVVNPRGIALCWDWPSSESFVSKFRMYQSFVPFSVGGRSAFSLVKTVPASAACASSTCRQCGAIEHVYGASSHLAVTGVDRFGVESGADNSSALGEAIFLQCIAGATLPSECPSGAYCRPNAKQKEVLPQAGYFRFPPLSDTLGSPNSLLFVQCPGGAKACTGVRMDDSNTTEQLGWERSAIASGLTNEGCAEGYTGALCLTCGPHYARTGSFGCSKCSSREAVWAVVIIGTSASIAAVVFIIYRAIRKGGETGHIAVGVAKIVISHMQTVALARTFPLRWPQSLNSFFGLSETISSGAGSVFAPDCLINEYSDPFFFRSSVVAALPVVGIVVIIVVWSVIVKSRKVLRERIIVSCLVWTFMVHLLAVTTALALFVCKDVGDTAFLEADMRVECGTAQHFKWALGIGIPMLIMYGIGFPLSKGMLLRALSKKGKLETKRHTYGFCYVAYRPECYWWENVIVARKVAVAGSGVLLLPVGEDLQTYAALLFIFGAAVLHVRWQPFHHTQLNELETKGLLALAGTFFCGLFLFSKNTSHGFREFFTVLILMLNAAFFCLAFYMAFANTLLNLRRAHSNKANGATPSQSVLSREHESLEKSHSIEMTTSFAPPNPMYHHEQGQ